ncbi:Adenylate kinase [uncultured archaeon]|nr:Adenylate kinase [uncultured archaeon]
MSKIVILTGIPGSGKTSIMDEALKVLKRGGKKAECVNFGDVMLEVAGVKNRDEMRKLPQEKQVENQRKAASKIASMAQAEAVFKDKRTKTVVAEKPDVLFVDTHCTVRTPSGYLPGLPEWVLHSLRPNVIVLIEADPSQISRRRQADETRKRDEESEDEIALHQEVNRAAAISYCMVTGASMKIIKNRDKHLLDAVKQLTEMF